MAFNQRLVCIGCYMVSNPQYSMSSSLTEHSGTSTVYWSIRICVDEPWPTPCALDRSHDIFGPDSHCQCKNKPGLVLI